MGKVDFTFRYKVRNWSEYNRALVRRGQRAGEEELFKAHARERGSVRVIDIVTARLDAKSDSYLATLPSLRLSDVRIGDKMVSDHDRRVLCRGGPRL